MVIIYQGFFTTIVSDDPTYNIGFTSSAIETNLAIITASMPMMRPLLVQWFPKLLKSTNEYSNRYGNGYGNSYGNTFRDGQSSGVQKSTRTGHFSHYNTGIGLKDMTSRSGRTEIRSESPTGSEEEIMTYK